MLVDCNENRTILVLISISEINYEEIERQGHIDRVTVRQIKRARVRQRDR